MVNSEELIPVLSAMRDAMDLNMEQTKDVFITLALFVHGYASIIVNNFLEYDEELIKVHLARAYTGAILAIFRLEDTACFLSGFGSLLLFILGFEANFFAGGVLCKPL